MERCAAALKVSMGGVLVEEPDGGLQLVGSTSPEMQRLEQMEMEHREGPCLDAYRSGEQVLGEDLATEYVRWPSVAPFAVEIGLAAVYAFPMRWRGMSVGALNLYRDTPGKFEREDVRLAQAFADVAVIGILQERKVSEAERRSQHLQLPWRAACSSSRRRAC